jgi:hypothetical protein
MSTSWISLCDLLRFLFVVDISANVVVVVCFDHIRRTKCKKKLKPNKFWDHDEDSAFKAFQSTLTKVGMDGLNCVRHGDVFFTEIVRHYKSSRGGSSAWRHAETRTRRVGRVVRVARRDLRRSAWIHVVCMAENSLHGRCISARFGMIRRSFAWQRVLSGGFFFSRGSVRFRVVPRV